MVKFEKILFVYSIIAVTLVFITSGIFAPTPQNLISGVLLLPIIAFFWLRMSNPQSTTLGMWSARLLIIIFLLTGLGGYAYFLSQTTTATNQNGEEKDVRIQELEKDINKLKEEAKTNEELEGQLTDIKDELKKLGSEGKLTLGAQGKDSQIGDLLAELEAEKNLPLGNVGVESEIIGKASVYLNPDFASEIIETINFGASSPYFEVNGNWYKIQLPDETFGWVHERDVSISD